MILVLATLAMFAQDTVSYADAASWLCRPGRTDACAIDLTTTVLRGDGTRTSESWSAAKDPPIDCFYIYPTVSRDAADRSDIVPGDEERDVVRQQFARFASLCRPFAPMYRQVTLRGLNRQLAASGADLALNGGIGYDDVLRAWNHYLANDNRGRGVVLIGHSQGAMILDELIRRTIDGKPIQARIVSALLLGTSIAVPKGKDVGGSFQSMSLCRRDDQVGCVITFASFRSTVPPSARALFGRVAGDGMEAACTNPAALGGGSAALHSYFSGTGSIFDRTATQPFTWSKAAPVTTPFVSVPGLLTAECVSDAAGSRLAVAVHADPADPRADDIPGDIGPGAAIQGQWGLHLVDMSTTMGNLIDVVRRQAARFQPRGP